MSEKINLEEIIRNTIIDILNPKLQNPGQSLGIANKMIEKDWYVKQTMLEFGKQLLKLASENAECKLKIKIECNKSQLENGFVFGTNAIIINKQSILDTIKQVE